MWCVEVGGEPVEPRVCIAGEIVRGGMDDLQRCRPHQFCLLEVYYAKGGASIRAYIHAHMAALARGLGSIRAEEPSPQRAGVEGFGWSSEGTPTNAPLFRSAEYSDW